MDKIHTDMFKITYMIGQSCVCTSQLNGKKFETLVHVGFMRAYKIKFNEVFYAEVDSGGQILLETIKIY